MHSLMTDTCKRLLVSGCVLLLLSLAACSKTDGEEAIRSLVQEGVNLAESHDLGGRMDLLDEGFTAGPGEHGKPEVRRILFVMLKRYGNFRILYPNPAIRLSDDEQTAVVKMNFLIARKQQLFPELELLYSKPAAWLEAVDKGVDLYTLSMELGVGSGRWLLRRARLTGYARPHGRL